MAKNHKPPCSGKGNDYPRNPIYRVSMDKLGQFFLKPQEKEGTMEGRKQERNKEREEKMVNLTLVKLIFTLNKMNGLIFIASDPHHSFEM